jgi:hypothetical protein
MSHAALSLIISCEYDLQSDTTQVRIVRVDTGENVRLRDGSFLLRCSTNGQTRAQRCLIRHIASGREAYVQGGANLRTFVKTCLLSNNEPETSEGPAPPQT